MKKVFIPLLLTLLLLRINAQVQRVQIPGSEIRMISSKIVVGQEYELQILLPASYATSSKKYPVLYLMDSQWDFPLLKSIYGQQYYDGFIPEMIIVGVTWGGVNPNPDSLRARDYTPTREQRLPQSGGADKFLSFMKEELFPFIESNYRADSENRTLMGCSLGGLFTLYALFTHTDMFYGFVAASPAYGWDHEVIYKYEKSYVDKEVSTAARLYMSMGGVERGVPGFERLTKALADRKYKNIKFKTRVLDNTGHSGTKAEGFARGLQYVFERPQVKLDPQFLRRYEGTYQMANGTKIEISAGNNRLEVGFPGNDKYIIYPSSETDFFATSQFLNVHFKRNGEKVEGFLVEWYGGGQFIEKVK